ncbi:hypothetical protein KW817_24610, partial [Enterobacter quasiroggenkampii]|nr:hypothetical protein [Enterobacter quasiroggenkampii]
EGVCARYAHDIDEVNRYLKEGAIPVLADEHGELLPALHPDVVVDAIIAKRNVAGTHRKMAPCTIALGPGFALFLIHLLPRRRFAVFSLFLTSRSPA